MRERLYSLENEYGVIYEPASDERPPDNRLLRETLVQTLRDQFGVAGNEFVVNGSRVYNDDHQANQRGHPEISLPECRSPRQVILYDRLADQMVRAALPATQQRLARQGLRGAVHAVKINVDAVGHTCGCHENYLAARRSDMFTGALSRRQARGQASSLEGFLDAEPYFRYLIQNIVPFLVTRQIICGAGKLIPNGVGKPASFHIAQRASYIQDLYSAITTRQGVGPGNAHSMRGIIDLSRELEETSLSDDRTFRFHLILGDFNLSEWVNWMKLGMTGLVLRMIEDLYVTSAPDLRNAVETLHQIAADPSCRAPVRLADNSETTAIAIQRGYLSLAETYTREFGASEEENQLLAHWQKALDDLEHAPPERAYLALADRADWPLKYLRMERVLSERGKTLASPLDAEEIKALQHVELDYHLLTEHGLFVRVPPAPSRRVVTDEALERARQAPPLTRAAIRHDLLALAAQGVPLTVDWRVMTTADRVFDLPDACAFGDRAVYEWLTRQSDHAPYAPARARMIERWHDATREDDPDVRLRAVSYLEWTGDERALTAIMRMAEDDPDPRVRSAAIAVLRNLSPDLDRVRQTLTHCRQRDSESRVRGAAQITWKALEAKAKDS